jgi:hypothetical protein
MPSGTGMLVERAGAALDHDKREGREQRDQ